MGQKLQTASNERNPGPGTYNHKGTLEVPSSKFGTSQRQSLGLDKGSPGPGQHNPDYKKLKNDAPRYGFGSESRNASAMKNQVPGPGNYELKSLIGEGPKQTMHATIDYTPDKKENAFKPGPGHYNDDFSSVKKREAAYKIGTATRADLDTKKRLLCTVSPDKYNPNYTAIKNQSAKWGFGSDKRKGLSGNENTPGAGTYSIPSRMIEGPKYVMGSRLNDGMSPEKNKNPGPGTYNTHEMENLNMKFSAKYKFGSATRLPPMRGQEVPGPGNYMSSLVDKRAAPKFGFGTQKRDGSPGMNSTFPGPGEYKLGGLIGRDGPSVSMHNKLKTLG